MTTTEIDKLLNDEYDDFLNKPYSGHVSIPEDILDLFKKSIMALPPFAHKISFYKVKNIAAKKISELNNGDLQDVVKVILNTPLQELYGEFNYAVSEHLKTEKFILSYNNSVEEMQKKLQSKKVALTNLTEGVRGNGMRIIPKA